MAFFEEGLEVQIDSDVSNGLSGIDRLESSLMDARGAVLGVGAAMAGLSAAGLWRAADAATEFEDAITEVEKRTGEEVAGEMRGEILDMANEIPLAQEELAGLVDDAARFGIEGSENLRSFTESTARMATATTLNTDKAAEAFAKLSELTDTPIEDVENLGSSINTLSNNFATSSQEIVDASLRSAGALTQMGLEQTEIFGLTAALNEVSESSQRAGTRIRRMAQTLMDPSKIEGIADALGMSVEEFKQMREEDPTAVIMQMVEAFDEGGEKADALRDTLDSRTRQAVAGLAQNSEGLEEALNTSSEAFKEGESLQKEFNTEMEKTSAQVQVLKNQLRGIAIETGENLLPAISTLLEYASAAVERFREWNNRSDGLAATAVLLGGLTTGLIMVIGALASLAPVAGAAAGAVGALGTAVGILLGPVGLIIAAVAALGVAWQRNLFGIQDKTGQAVSGIRSIFNDFLAWFGPLWDEHFSETAAQVRQTAAAWQSAISGFVEWATPFLEAWFALLQATWELFGDDVIAVATYLFDALRGIVEFGLDAIATQIQIVLALLRGDWEEAWTLLAEFSKDTLDGLINFVGKWGGRLVTRIVEIIKGAGTAAASAFKDAFNEGIPDTVDIPGAEVAGQSFGGGSIELPSLDTGGMISESGVAEVHAGERVVPAEQVGQGGGMARELADALSGLGDQQVRVIFEGGDAITEAVQREARVVVERNNEQTRRKIRRLQERG